MARFDRLTVYNTMMAEAMMPLFYHPESSVAQQVAGALARGGGHLLEFTSRGDGAINVFVDLFRFCARDYPQLILGVGSVEDEATAALYIAQGANFIVAPTFNPAVARLCNRRKIPYIPGCGTVSEIASAEELGAEVIKLFPADALDGKAFVKAILAPRPWTRIMPSGGVSPEEANLRAWFAAGVCCVGMGSKLIRSDWLEAGDFAAIEALTRDTLALIRTLRGR
ncbi:MAG: bifunctional 4-hydroxy-2-oxoglutarate aldolase/2-dehydro-3-deoxy-phosphogluconate aldolase [Anaerolineae bacterium]|jgi:2-dehydro-3-deoxyphosphogluconate aldolase/(4S)-4-hydroxy-2-oxoglutarate aldolase|nr:bifunctional 4-hydroxy-2-oxoglutarate aldolase/2-dehydro-3-deoxy-phosphogluconate aldolase [Anaerolineae bacterium]